MRIFFPVEVLYPSQAGGTANTIYWLARRLVENGEAPVVVASDRGLSSEIQRNRWTDTDAGRVIYVRTHNYNFPLRQTLYSFREVLRADVVKTSSIFYPSCTASALAASILGKKLVVSALDELSEYGLNRSRKRKAPFLWLSKLLLPRHAVFHATTEREIEEIRSVFGSRPRVVLIPDYIEVPPQLGRAPQEPYLLFIGRLHQKKGIDRLIEAVALSRSFLDSDVVLKIAGRSFVGYEDELQKLVHDHGLDGKVRFVGQVEGVEKEQLLADAAWTFMPSISENFGVVAAESLSQGTPVVASLGTPWKELNTEKAGFWIDNDPKVLAAKIDKILAMSKDEYSGYRQRARAFAEQRLDISHHMDEWLDLFRSL